MILPQSYPAALFLMVLMMLCWGSWVNTYKLGGKWRYELYYFDWALGALAMALILALTAGSLGFDGFSFRDDLLIAGKRQWLFAFLAGIIFNFGNMLLLAAVSLAGMALAYPMSAGVTVVVAAIISFVIGRPVPIFLLLLGCALALAASAVAAGAYRQLLWQRHESVARAGKAKSTRRPSSAKAIILAAASGVLLGSFFPLLGLAREGEVGLGPYSSAFLFALGAWLSALVLNLFLMNLPVEGEPLELLDYFHGHWTQHAFGLAGGVIWSGGLVAALSAASAPAGSRPNPMASDLLTQGATLVAVAWGWLAWREFSGANGRAKLLGGLTVVLYSAGLLLLAIAPHYVR